MNTKIELASILIPNNFKRKYLNQLKVMLIMSLACIYLVGQRFQGFHKMISKMSNRN